MTEFRNITPFSRHLLANLPPNVASNFTDTQLAYVEEAIENRPPRNHPVDIRHSIPLLGRRFHLVFLFGQEIRSPARRERDRAKRLLWMFGNVVTFALFLLLLLPAAAPVTAAANLTDRDRVYTRSFSLQSPPHAAVRSLLAIAARAKPITCNMATSPESCA